MAEINAALNEVHCTPEEREDLQYQITQAAHNIESWKAHILRSINQDAARHDILDDMDPNSAFILLDWAMKFVPRKLRESQRDWFAKRGLSWHIAVVTRKDADGNVTTLTFVHIFKSCSQDSIAVVGIIYDILSQLSVIDPEIHTVYLRQDNAGCYHSTLTLLSLPVIEKLTGIKIRRIDFSDPQGGKGACDHKAAHIKTHMNKYLNSGKDIESPEQMMSAMESFEGIPGLKVVVCSLLPSAGCVAGKWDSVSLINNIEYADKTMKVWLAYNTGPGKVLPLSDFVLPLSVPTIIHKNETEGVVSFVKVKARIRKRKGQHDEENSSETDDETERGGDEQSSISSNLFPCPEQGCVKSYQRYSSLEKHLHCGSHHYALEHETLYDKAMKSYAARLEEGASKNPEPVQSADLPQFEANPELAKGWALKSSGKKKRFFQKNRKHF